jgi:hypothetical protein
MRDHTEFDSIHRDGYSGPLAARLAADSIINIFLALDQESCLFGEPDRIKVQPP